MPEIEHQPNWNEPLVAVFPSEKAECRHCVHVGNRNALDLECDVYVQKPDEVIFGGGPCPMCEKESQCLSCCKRKSALQCEAYDEIPAEMICNHQVCASYQECE